MSTIMVMLSTTGYTLESDIPLEILKRLDVPVCVAEMGLMMFGFFKELETQEHHMAQTCLQMAKQVHVDSKTRYVFVGENPAIPETGLVEYTDDVNKPQTDAFFKRWDELHMLLFEFTVFGQTGARFAIKGLWEKDHWNFINVTTGQSLRTISKDQT